MKKLVRIRASKYLGDDQLRMLLSVLMTWNSYVLTKEHNINTETNEVKFDIVAGCVGLFIHTETYIHKAIINESILFYREIDKLQSAKGGLTGGHKRVEQNYGA